MASLPQELRCLNPLVVGGLVRIGNRADGGYVVPEQVLREADALISFGVSTDWSFESQLIAKNPEVVVHAYDPTVSHHEFLSAVKYSVLKLVTLRGSLRETRERLQLYRSYRDFFQKSTNVRHFSERVYNRVDNPTDATIDAVIARLAGRRNIILKMDIEGGEFRVIDDILRYVDRISLMIVEFHNTEPLREIFLQKVQAIGRHYEVVHLHGNNYAGAAKDGLPDCLEMTFLAKSLASGNSRRDKLPVEGLDFPNRPDKKDFELSFKRDD